MKKTGVIDLKDTNDKDVISNKSQEAFGRETVMEDYPCAGNGY